MKQLLFILLALTSTTAFAWMSKPIYPKNGGIVGDASCSYWMSAKSFQFMGKTEESTRLHTSCFVISPLSNKTIRFTNVAVIDKNKRVTMITALKKAKKWIKLSNKHRVSLYKTVKVIKDVRVFGGDTELRITAENDLKDKRRWVKNRVIVELIGGMNYDKTKKLDWITLRLNPTEVNKLIRQLELIPSKLAQERADKKKADKLFK